MKIKNIFLKGAVFICFLFLFGCNENINNSAENNIDEVSIETSLPETMDNEIGNLSSGIEKHYAEDYPVYLSAITGNQDHIKKSIFNTEKNLKKSQLIYSVIHEDEKYFTEFNEDEKYFVLCLKDTVLGRDINIYGEKIQDNFLKNLCLGSSDIYSGTESYLYAKEELLKMYKGIRSDSFDENICYHREYKGNLGFYYFICLSTMTQEKEKTILLENNLEYIDRVYFNECSKYGIENDKYLEGMCKIDTKIYRDDKAS